MLLTEKTAENRQILEAICFLLYDRKILKENKKKIEWKVKKILIQLNESKNVSEKQMLHKKPQNDFFANKADIFDTFRIDKSSLKLICIVCIFVTSINV